MLSSMLDNTLCRRITKECCNVCDDDFIVYIDSLVVRPWPILYYFEDVLGCLSTILDDWFR